MATRPTGSRNSADHALSPWPFGQLLKGPFTFYEPYRKYDSYCSVGSGSAIFLTFSMNSLLYMFSAAQLQAFSRVTFMLAATCSSVTPTRPRRRRYVTPANGKRSTTAARSVKACRGRRWSRSSSNGCCKRSRPRRWS